MILGVIEITSRLTRLSVLEIGATSSARIVERSHTVTADLHNLERLTALLMAEVEAARDLGSERIEILAEPELRGSRLIRLLERVTENIGAGNIRIPADRERIAAAFLAATIPGNDSGNIQATTVGVALVTDTTLGLGVGSPGCAPEWIGTRPVGAATISSLARFSDPPRPHQIDAAITGACRKTDSLEPPDMDQLLVSSEYASVISRLCGPSINHDDARRGLDSILGQTSDDLAAWFGIEPATSRYLPGAIVGHAALADAFGVPAEPVVCNQSAGRYWLGENRQITGRNLL